MMSTLIKLFIVFLTLTSSSSLSAAEKIEIATHYDYLPWISGTSSNSGMTALLTKKLNLIGKGKYIFSFRFYPRKRLDKFLEKKSTLIIPWVHPNYFSDKTKTKYLWSDEIAKDESYFISLNSNKFEYSGIESFKGKRFSATLGHNYADMESEIASGNLYREDAPSLENSVNKLLSGRRNLDFAVIDRSTLAALGKNNSFKINDFYISKKPRAPAFSRHILIPKDRPDLLKFINSSIKTLASDPEWNSNLISFKLN